MEHHAPESFTDAPTNENDHYTNGKTRVAGTWRMEGGTVMCDNPGMFKIHCHRGLLANAPGGGTRQVIPEDGDAFMDALLETYRSLTTAEEI